MTAYRITSSEYYANTPSVFLFVEGKYYGDTIYALRDGFPQDVNHWRNAICSDEGRFFKVEEVECPRMIFEWMGTIQEKIDENKRWIDKGVDDNICFRRILSYNTCIVEMIKKL